MKKFLLFAILIACLTSCQGPKTPEVTIAEFDSKAPEMVGQEITIKGVAKHICHNSGRKLFLAANAEDEKLVNVVANEQMDKFDVETEGKNYIVNGTVEVASIIDTAYLNEWEKEVIENGVKEGTHICATEQQAEGIEIPEDEENPQMIRIKAYRDKIAENNGEPIVFYQVVCNTFTVE